jgi:Autotransporter beta-domain
MWLASFCFARSIRYLAALVLLISTGAQVSAQCHNTFNFGVGSLGPDGTVKNLNPTTSPLISITNTVNTAFFTNTTAFVSSPGAARADQQSGGVWGRAVGGVVDSEARTIDKPSAKELFPGEVTSGTQVCNQSNHHTYAGFQVGADIGKLNIGNSGGSWHFGIMAGYLTASAKDTTPGISDGTFNNTYAPGDLTAQFQVPFAGLYSVFTQGNFVADAQVRWDWYQSRSSSPGNNYFGALQDAQGVSVAGGLYYRLALPQNWFVEPSVGGVWSRVHVDPLTTPLALSSDARGTLRVEDIDSLLGRASIRVGVNLTQGIYAWQPFAVASVIHEFADEVKSTLTVSDPDSATFNGLVFSSSTARVGTYGQFGAGVGVVAGNTGWTGYGRVDVKVGENVEGLGLNMGLRYQW